MCGILTIVQKSQSNPLTISTVEMMVDLVTHRGPDGRGTEYFQRNGDEWYADSIKSENQDNSQWQLALGHRRLSILDLSNLGKQPMSYRDRYWITFNGEIYNYIELRDELKQLGHQFKSDTDTEVILAAYAEWDVEAIPRLRGMWGFVIWDRTQNQLLISRDRIGIKPIYFVNTSDFFVVCSEIKQLSVLPNFQLQANQTAVQNYLLTGYEDHRSTFFQDVHTLPAGSYCLFDLTTNQRKEPVHFWHPEQITPSISSFQEATESFQKTFDESVLLHLRSDVPVGCALSGGLDSSAIAASVVSQLVSKHRLQTFSVTFPNHPLDEKVYIDQIVKHLAVEPHFIAPDPEIFLAEFDRFVWMHDEPVGSLSQYAGYCVARLTREHQVPVTLNGQGGDEVFSGYWQCYFSHLSGKLRSIAALQVLATFLRSGFLGGNYELIKQVPKMLKRYQSRKKPPLDLIHPNLRNNNEGTHDRVSQVLSMKTTERRLYDLRELTLPRLLKWDDRNFMAWSVEGRYPFLDHKVMEVCLSFSSDVLYSKGWVKEPLRRSLVNRLPKTIVRRRSKIGFEPPHLKWFKTTFKVPYQRFLKSESPIWDYLHQPAVANLATSVWEGKDQSQESIGTLFRIWNTDRWLKVFQL